MTDRSTSNSARQLVVDISALWWLPLIRGILLLVGGVFALFQPAMTLATFAQVAGFFLVLDGILAIAAGVSGQVPSRLWTIIRGGVAVLAGIFVFANPVLVAGLTASVVVSVVGGLAVLSGAMEIVAAIQDRREIEGEGWLILGGVLLVLIGIALLATPLLFGLSMVRGMSFGLIMDPAAVGTGEDVSMVRVLGALAIASSIAMIVFAFRLKGLKSALTDLGSSTEQAP